MARRDEIVAAIRDSQVVVICGETGSGKSTQLPKLCLEAGCGTRGFIGHTQPRRIAARSVAARVAEEMGTTVGDLVGFKIRFTEDVSPDTYIKVMTDGILLAEVASDRSLEQYDTIIIDEAHERSLNIDFLLGHLRNLVEKRPELKLIITSATIDPQRIAAHFADAPVIEVSGRTFPVDIRYAEEESTRDVVLQAVDVTVELLDPQRGIGGDVLVFFSGEREILEAARRLRGYNDRLPGGHPSRFEVLPLYARLSAKDQQRVFAVHPGRRVILATNVAETSITVPGILAVVDTGVARISRYSPRTRVQRLPVEAISQASARQRAGRCGRVAPGVCLRLYTEADHDGREEYTAPEILRTNLAGVILRMKALRLGEVRSFPFIDPPSRGMVRDGYDTLQELGALDDKEQLTDLGRRLARLPVDPRLARILLAAGDENCLHEALILASALELQDPRERPLEHRDAADQKHVQFRDADSDFLGVLALWEWFHEARRTNSWNQLRRLCQENFVSFVRMREWQDLQRQLVGLTGELGLKPSGERAPADRVHRAVLAGLLGSIGRLEEKKTYRGARGGEMFLFPGSSLFKKPPKWIMSAEVVETTKRYARMNARIRPEWIEEVGRHLLKFKHVEPFWDEDRGQAMIYERVMLFGLEIVARRRRTLGPIDAVSARELFIHHALVEGDVNLEVPFFVANQQRTERLRDEEAKRRRRDVVVDPTEIFAFYDARLPKDIWSVSALQQWCRRNDRTDPDGLLMTDVDLLRPDATLADADAFPDRLLVGGRPMELEYELEPGTAQDGVTVLVPLAMVPELSAPRLAWLVPGLLEEKIEALLRGLPKTIRRQLVPIPETARVCAASLRDRDGELTSRLAAFLLADRGVTVPPGEWSIETLPDHLRFNIRVVSERGETLHEGRDLHQLRTAMGETVRKRLADVADGWAGRREATSWEFDTIEKSVMITQDGTPLRVYPTLEDHGGSVMLTVVADARVAERELLRGVRRLFMLQCRRELLAHLDDLPRLGELRLHWHGMPQAVRQRHDLNDAVLLRTVDQAFLSDGKVIRTSTAFRKRLDAKWGDLWTVASSVTGVLAQIVGAHHRVALEFEAASPPGGKAVLEPARRHLVKLVDGDLFLETPWGWLHQVPRYLAAAQHRIARIRAGEIERDRELEQQIAPWQHRLDLAATTALEYSAVPRALIDFRWLLEEWRVALFAQQLGTAMPVSEKKLAEQWKRAESAPS